MEKEKNMKLSVDELANMSALQALWECNKHHLDEIAITIKADTNVLDRTKKTLTTIITYRTLFNNIFKTIDALKRQGVKKGDTVSFASITTPELIYTAYACIGLQATFDPIDPRSKAEELIHHFENEPSKLYFAPEKMFDSTKEVYKDIKVDRIITTSFTESLPRIIQIGSKILEKKQGIKPFENPDERIFSSYKQFIKGAKIQHEKLPFDRDQIISYAHTTGSTGLPKAICHTNENWNAQLYSISNSELEFVRGESLFNVTVPWVDFGLINVIHAFLCNGIRMDLDLLWTPEQNVDFYLKYRDNWWLGAPGWIDPLFTDPKYEGSDVSFGKYIITGGAPLFEHKQRLYRNKLKTFNSSGKIVQGYGLSEGTAAAFIDTHDNAGYIGYPMPGFRIDVKDPVTFESVNPSESGELWLTAAYPQLSPIAMGYLNNEEETKKTFKTDEDGNRWVKTGDKVHCHEDKLTKWESRYKNILTYNGFNIDLDKLLDAVENVPGVNKGAIIGAITADGNQRPLVCIDLAPNIRLNDADYIKEDILNMIKDKFKDYYEPLDIIVYEQLPQKTMKIDYNQLKADNLNEHGEYIKSPNRGIRPNNK